MSLHADRPTEGSLLPDREKVCDPHALAADGWQRMTAGRALRHMGTGDARPPVLRAGALDAATLPSRTGSRLHWPDGRVGRAGDAASASATPQPAPAPGLQGVLTAAQQLQTSLDATTTQMHEALEAAQRLAAAFGIAAEDLTP